MATMVLVLLSVLLTSAMFPYSKGMYMWLLQDCMCVVGGGGGGGGGGG